MKRGAVSIGVGNFQLEDTNTNLTRRLLFATFVSTTSYHCFAVYSHNLQCSDFQPLAVGQNSMPLKSTTPNWWEDYPCLREVSTEDVNVDLDVLQAGINLSGRGKFHRDRASRRVAMRRLYQRHPVNTLCQEGVRQCAGMMAAMLIIFLILYRIRSKRSRAQPDRIKTRNRAAVVRAIKVDREDHAKVKGGVMTYRKSSDHKAERNVVRAVKADHSTNLCHCEGSSCSAKAIASLVPSPFACEGAGHETRP